MTAPPTSWLECGGRPEGWQHLLDCARSPDAAQNLTRKLRVIHDDTQLPSGEALGEIRPAPHTPAVEALKQAARAYNVELPPEFVIMAERLRCADARWRPVSEQHPFGSAILFPITFDARHERHDGLQARVRSLYQRNVNGLLTLTTFERRIPLIPQDGYFHALVPEGAFFDVEWAWTVPNDQDHVLQLGQVVSYNRQGLGRISAHRIPDGENWSRVALELRKPYCAVPAYLTPLTIGQSHNWPNLVPT